MVGVALIGTCDTKLEELLFLREQILQTPSTDVILIDAGIHETKHKVISITQPQLLENYGSGDFPVGVDTPRGDSIKYIADCATKAAKELYGKGIIHGIIAAGGSGGTSIASAVMRDGLPIGFPKLIVSTMASGDTGPIIGETDITLMYSVVDIAGLNQVLRNVLSNAAAAIAAMAQSYSAKAREARAAAKKKRVGITMFGVTTPCVNSIREYLESHADVETYIFHATGHGGKAMERLVREGGLDGVIDLTTTEICDYFTGGNMSAGPNRLEAAAEAGIPNLISLGATDMTNFGPKSSVPERYQDRLLYVHNSTVTLMRSSAEECEKVGCFIATKLKEHARRPDLIQVWIPKGGVSMLSTSGGPYEDSEADKIMFETLKRSLHGTGIEVIEDDRAINDEGFAQAVAKAFLEKASLEWSDIQIR